MSAYKIWKRQSGSAGIAAVYNGTKAGAAAAGVSDYLVMGNDIAPCMLGWNRGYVDMASSELSLNWNLSSVSNGIGLPPFGRVAPFYKASQEHANSLHSISWLYNDGFVTQCGLTPVANTIFYEMLATNTTQKMEPTNTEMVGNPTADQAFFQFIASKASPEFGQRSRIEDVGIYLSTSSINWQWTPQGVLNFNTGQPHHFAVWGWATALDELQYQYRIIPEWKFNSAALSNLKVLIIPNASVFNASDVTTLTTWVNGGGILIVTGDSGSHQGESGNFVANTTLALSSLTGVTSMTGAPTTKAQKVGSGYVKFINSNYGLTFWDDTTTPERHHALTDFRP